MNRRSRDVFREISRNVWEIPVFGGSENFLLNICTHLHFVHISSFLARNWHFGIQRELVFWIFDIFWFWAIFGVILSQKCKFSEFLPNFGQNDPKDWPKSKNIKNPKHRFCLYSKMPGFCQKLGNMDKMEMSSVV